MAVQGVIVRIGFEPNTQLFRDQIEMDNRAYAIISSLQETSVENVFAVGDVANPLAPTISSAVGAGATAARVIASRLGTW
jgi:thioredoxin reductase (NADPH)